MHLTLNSLTVSTRDTSFLAKQPFTLKDISKILTYIIVFTASSAASFNQPKSEANFHQKYTFY